MNDKRLTVAQWLAKTGATIGIELTGGNDLLPVDHPHQWQARHYQFTIGLDGREIHWHIQSTHDYCAIDALDHIANVMLVWRGSKNVHDYQKNVRGLVYNYDAEEWDLHCNQMAKRDREMESVLGDSYATLLETRTY